MFDRATAGVKRNVTQTDGYQYLITHPVHIHGISILIEAHYKNFKIPPWYQGGGRNTFRKVK